MKKLYLIIAGVVLVSLAVVVFVNNRKYLVTFDSNGGTPIESMKVKKGGTIEQPSNPTKEGSIFIGWTENGKAFSFSTKITKNIILTAAWQEIKENVETYTVKFDSDGGSAILDQVVEKGKLVKKPEDPVKDKYTFIGWTLNDVDYDFSEAVNSDIVLKAKWEQTKESEDKNSLTNDNSKKSTKKTNSTTATNNSKQETNNKTNTQITLSTPTLTERGRGGDQEQFGIIYKITNVESTDGIEVYKSTIGSNYLLEATLTTSKLAQINNEIQIVAKTNEHNYYKVRSYKVVDGAKKYSDYSAVVEVVGPTLSTPLLTEEGRGADINEAGILYKVENVGYADGIEVYKSNNTNDYQLLNSMAMTQLEQAESKILVTAGLGEHNYYKVRSYKVVDGVKKYSNYSIVVDVTGPSLSIPTLTEEGRGADINEAGILYKVENVGYADGIEVYKSANGSSYQLLSTMTIDQLIGAESKILVTAGLGEHNYYKVRSYKVVGSVKKYSDYSTVVDVSH